MEAMLLLLLCTLYSATPWSQHALTANVVVTLQVLLPRRGPADQSRGRLCGRGVMPRQQRQLDRVAVSLPARGAVPEPVLGRRDAALAARDMGRNDENSYSGNMTSKLVDTRKKGPDEDQATK